jgi:hypothetical protein
VDGGEHCGEYLIAVDVGGYFVPPYQGWTEEIAHGLNELGVGDGKVGTDAVVDWSGEIAAGEEEEAEGQRERSPPRHRSSSIRLAKGTPYSSEYDIRGSGGLNLDFSSGQKDARGCGNRGRMGRVEGSPTEGATKKCLCHRFELRVMQLSAAGVGIYSLYFYSLDNFIWGSVMGRGGGFRSRILSSAL